MRPSLLHRMDSWTRQLLPFGSALLLLVVSVMPLRLPGFAGVAPLLALMAVFYWSIYRPDLMPPWAAFTLGLLQDFIGGTPLGVWAMVYLLAQGVVASQRRFFLSNAFLAAWWGFGLIAAHAALLAWLLVSLLHARLLDPRAVAFQYLMTMAVYPPVAWGLARTQVAFLRQA